MAGAPEPALVVLNDALSAALVVARRDARDSTAPVPPKLLHRFLEFSRDVPPALDAARRALGADEGFRQRVAAATENAPLSAAARAFLIRGDGWEDEVAIAIEAEEDARIRQQETAELAALQTDLEDLRQQLNDSAAALLQSETLRRAGEDEIARLNAAAEALSSERDAALAEVADLHEQRRRAVSELSAAKALAERRLVEVRELSAAVEELRAAPVVEVATAPPERGPSVERVGPDPAVAAELRAIADRLSALAGDAQRDPTAHDDTVDPDESVTDQSVLATTLPPERRRAIRLGRGIIEDSVEGATALLALPGVLLLVDGWNVSQLGWPHLDGPAQRVALEQSLAHAAPLRNALVRVVWDGSGIGSAPRADRGGRLAVEFTPEHLEADDRIIELVARTPPERPVAVASNDRRIRDGVRAAGANAVRSDHLLALLV
jgi:predicted RNA-binding protein with PIN domain